VSTATARAALPLAAVIDDLRSQHAGATGHVARNLKLDIRWAELDRARAITADPAAHALAVELAEEGDEDAIAALRLAAELEPLGPPTSAAVPGTARATGSLASGGAVPPGLLDRLAAARRHGQPFDEAWGSALAALAVSGPWAEILRATRLAWESAYERRPAPPGCVVLAWGDED